MGLTETPRPLLEKYLRLRHILQQEKNTQKRKTLCLIKVTPEFKSFRDQGFSRNHLPPLPNMAGKNLESTVYVKVVLQLDRFLKMNSL